MKTETRYLVFYYFNRLLGAFLWPLTVIRLWIMLIAQRLANSKQPHLQQNQSALLLAIQTVYLNQRVLCLDSSPAIRPPLEFHLPSDSGYFKTAPSAIPPTMHGANAIQSAMNAPGKIHQGY